MTDTAPNPPPASAAWVNSDPLMEAVAAAVWEHCHTEGSSTVTDDPRTIAAAAVGALRAAAPSEPADRITLDRGSLAALLAHHADVLAARWHSLARAAGPGSWEVAAALSLREHAGDLTDSEETSAVAELLDNAMAFPPSLGPVVEDAPADLARRDRIAEALYAHDHPGHLVPLDGTGMGPAYRETADAVLAVLPAPADRAGEIERLHAENERLRHELEVMYGGAFDRLQSPQVAEDHHLALSLALDLGTGAPWDAIQDRAAEVVAELAATVADLDAACEDGAAAAQRPAPADRAAVLEPIREVVRRLAAHAAGFQDVLDESDRGPWGRMVSADIAELRRLADEAQQGEPGGPTATLVIGRSSSHCGNCNEPTLTRYTHHTNVSGWAPRPGGGCGARFIAMRSDCGSVTADDLKEIRPDLPVEATIPNAAEDNRP